MGENMNAEELKLVTSVLDMEVEIWVEDALGSESPITDYEYDLENNRIVLKV